MKAFITFTSLIAVLALSSCTKTLYTHEQVMSRYHNKKEVIARFGLPTDKRISDGVEEWYYDFGSVSTASTYGNANTGASVNRVGNTLYGNANTNAYVVTRYNNQSRYIKFVFNEEDTVSSWHSQGVPMAEKIRDKKKTWLLVGSLLLIGAVNAATESK